MKKLTVLAAGLLLLVPSLAFSDSFSLRLGYFRPGASTDIISHFDSLWAIEFDQMTFQMKDFRGLMMGASYEYFLGKNLSLAFTLDSFTKGRMGDYLYYDQTEFTDTWFAFPIEEEPSAITDWYYISHNFKVSSTPLQLSVKFTPLGRKTRLIPYVGGGAGINFWSVRMFGEMVNFTPEDDNRDRIDWFYDYETDSAYASPTDMSLRDVPIYPVESVNGRERGLALDLHAFAGVQFPISDRATIDAEVRYHWAKARFREWFQGFEDFDLGGIALTVGLSYWF
jgi:opacity protein-like surface antigen